MKLTISHIRKLAQIEPEYFIGKRRFYRRLEFRANGERHYFEKTWIVLNREMADRITASVNNIARKLLGE